MMTAYGTSQTSIDAIRAGAFEYLTKPLDLDQLRAVIGQALAAQAEPATRRRPRTRRRRRRTTCCAGRRHAGDAGRLQDDRAAGDQRRAGARPRRARHRQGARRRDDPRQQRPARPPVRHVDCAALPEDALEAELFAADAGTLHLASVHALPKPLQARLARALSDERSRVSTRQASEHRG